MIFLVNYLLFIITTITLITRATLTVFNGLSHSVQFSQLILQKKKNTQENILKTFRLLFKILNRYIMFGMGICEKYQSRDEKFFDPKGKGNLVSNTPPKHV
jgi:hypothetical protein